MAASGSDDRPRLRVSGIGAAVELCLDGRDAPELLHRLTRAWSRCLVPAAGQEDADTPNPGITGSTGDAGNIRNIRDASGTPANGATDPASRPSAATGADSALDERGRDHPARPAELPVTLDPTAHPAEPDQASGAELPVTLDPTAHTAQPDQASGAELPVTLDPTAHTAQPDQAGSAELLVTLDPTAHAAEPGRVSGADPETVMVQTTQAITRLLIESQTGRLLMLHAGAVAHPETGRTVVFVAPGGTGKTTLVRTLAGRYGYLSDETVAIDADYRVLPYPKPLSVRRTGAPKQEISPDELGLVAAPAEPIVVRLCLLDRDDHHAGAPEIVPLDLLDAITELSPQTSALYALPDGLRTLARLIEATGPVLQLRYAEAEDLLPTVDALLTNGEPTPPNRHPGLDPGSHGNPESTYGGDPRLRGDDEETAGDNISSQRDDNATAEPTDGTPRSTDPTPESAGSSPASQHRGQEGQGTVPRPGTSPRGATDPTPESAGSSPASQHRGQEGQGTVPRPGTSPRLPSSPRRRGSQQPADPGLRVHANQFADTLERDGEALVLLREGGLLRLNPLGASIVEFAVNPIRLDALAAALERRFGAPEGVDLLAATAERVEELAEQGALVLGEPPLPDAPGPFWRIADDTAYAVSTPDRVVVFNLATPAEQPQALVGTAAAIWQFLLGDDDNPRPWTSEPDLIADLADAYATEPATITPDVRDFLKRMHATGHLQSRPTN